MKKVVLIALLLSGGYYGAYSQPDSADQSFNRNQALNIFMDCALCDMDFIRTEFTTVNYVTERKNADVYLRVTTLASGGGGTEYTMIIKGYKRFAALADTLVFYLGPEATDDIIRTTLLENMQLGLVPFLLKTPARELLSLTIFDGDGFGQTYEDDKWKNWKFDVSASGSFSDRKSSTFYSVFSSCDLEKVTPEIKLESSTMFDFSENTLRLYDGDTLLYTSFISQKRISSSILFVKSLGEHFGVGGIGGYMTDEYLNLKNRVTVGPGVDYNIYKFSDASQKQLRFLYFIYYQYSGYMEETIYDKMEDHQFIHNFTLILEQNKEWGAINAGLTAENHLDDINLYYLRAYAMARIELESGLYLRFSSNCSYVHNQIELRKGISSTEEFLLGKNQVEQDFNYGFSIGIGFRFGSDFYNVVNPRFTFY